MELLPLIGHQGRELGKLGRNMEQSPAGPGECKNAVADGILAGPTRKGGVHGVCELWKGLQEQQELCGVS